jgi:hypothetical protein
MKADVHDKHTTHRDRFRAVLAAVVAAAWLGSLAAEDAANPLPGDPVLARIPVGMAENEIGVIADIPNLEPRGPAAITVNPDTADIFVLDAVNGRLVQVVPAASGAASLAYVDLASEDASKNVEYATDLVFANGALYVLDAAGRKVVKFNPEGEWMETFEIKNPDIQTGGSATLVVLANDDIRIREAGVSDLPIDPAAGRGAPTDKDALATARGAGVVSSKPQWSANGSSVQLSLESAGDGRAISQTIDVKSQEALASVELVGIDARGRYYVLASELDKEDRIHTALARYSSSGELDGVADIPVGDVVYLPNRFVAVDNKGTAYFLQPLSTEVLIVEPSFQSRENLSPPQGAVYEPRSRETALVVDEGFVAAVEEAAKDEPYEVPKGKISREQILKNAYAFLSIEWTLSPGNYGRNADNTCSPPRNWRRPKQLDGKLGKTIKAAPYKWGGYQSRSSIEEKLSQGLVAGDICTCRSASQNYCISSGTTGVDCSGFVSQSLQEKYHTTTGMSAITKPLAGLRSVKGGDILNRAGNHVRLVSKDAPESGPLVIKTIESAVSCGGVCEATYTAVQLAKYKPLRYKHVQETSQATSQEAPPATRPQAPPPAKHEAPPASSQEASADKVREEAPIGSDLFDQVQGWLDQLKKQFGGQGSESR